MCRDDDLGGGMDGESASRGPEFFLVGAPKCGTTALYTWLRAHPGIFMPDLKEPHFHSTDLPGLREITDTAAYAALFACAPAGCLRGEASASYLQSAEAVPRILAVRPDARFIAILRNPCEMAEAFHAELLATLREDAAEFAHAWALQPARARGQALPPRSAEPRLLQYAEVCALGSQLARFMARVPPVQRLVLFFDDLAADPSATHADILRFLGLPVQPVPDLARINARRRLRSRRLAALHADLPRLLGRFYAPAKRVGNAMGIHPSQIMARVNTARANPNAPNPAFRAELCQHFAPEIVRIEALTGRDLSHWREPRL